MDTGAYLGHTSQKLVIFNQVIIVYTASFTAAFSLTIASIVNVEILLSNVNILESTERNGTS